MREVKRIMPTKTCNCYKQEIFLDLNFSISFNDIPHFNSFGYKEKKSYTNAGIFYIEGKDLIAIGSIGSNRLQIKCKSYGCLPELDSFEQIIREMQ